MSRQPFAIVQALSSSATTPKTYTNIVGNPYELHLVGFTAEIGGAPPSGDFKWNFKLHGSQKYFFYQDFTDGDWGATVGYLPYRFPSTIVLPAQAQIDILYTPLTASAISGQLIILGWMQ